MKRILLAVVCAMTCAYMGFARTQSEASITGKVLDKATSGPAGWATVALMTADSTVVAGTACDESGTYTLKAPAGEYYLTAALIGYKDFAQTATIVAGANEMEPIYLETDAQMLASAKVTERVSLVEMKIDKVVMNVSQSAFAQGSNAFDLMKKAPGVTIDKDGNVKLNGKSVAIWVDGRPSYMDGKALENFLRSTNSESIDKFELMEHPSAKYDAAGQGGIINIKTKRNHLKGFNGSMGLGGGGMHFKEIDETPWQQSYWANLAYRTEKTNTFFSIYEGFYNNPIKIENELTMDDLLFRQVGLSTMLSFYHNYNVKLGTDWFIDDKNTVGVIAYVPGSYSTFNSKSSSTEQYLADVQTMSAKSSIVNGPSRAIRHNVNLNYTHIFDEARSAEITTNLDYYHNTAVEENRQYDTTYYAVAPLVPVYTVKAMDATNNYDIYSAKADYQSTVFKKFMMEAGAKWALSRTDDVSLETQTLMPDRPSDFLYSEHVAAAYASLAGQISPKWSFKAGLRGEYTNSFGDWRSSGTETRRSYFDLFPTVYLGFTPTEKWRLSATYSRRIERPRYYQMDPTKVYVDAKTYTVGNPDILPQYSNSVSLTAGLGQHFSWALTYSADKNCVMQIPSYDVDGTQYLTWGNVGRERVGAVSFNISALPVAKWLQWTLSANGVYLNTASEISALKTSCFMAQVYTDFSFLLPKDWKIDLDGYYMSPMHYSYYTMHSHWASNIAIKKTLLSNKMTLTLRVDDIFRSEKNNLDLADATASSAVTVLRQVSYNQKVIFDITWSFGQAQKPVRHRNVGNLEEMSRAGSGNNGGGIGK